MTLSAIRKTWLACLVWTAAAVGEPLDSAVPGERYLLFGDGAVRKGRVVETPNDWLLERNGGTITYPKHRVRHAADSLGELYQFKTDSIPPNDAGAHFELYRWCLQFGAELQPFAEQELRTILTHDPENARAASALRSLQKRDENPTRESPASANEAAPAVAVDPALMIERFAEGNGPEMLAEFAQHLESILTNRCGTCHASIHHSGNFRLYRRSNNLPNDQSLTARNLQSVLEMIDIDHPDDSPLLHYSLAPHGHRGERPLGGPNDPKFVDLRQWVHAFATNSVGGRQRLVDRPAPIPPTPGGDWNGARPSTAWATPPVGGSMAPRLETQPPAGNDAPRWWLRSLRTTADDAPVSPPRSIPATQPGRAIRPAPPTPDPFDPAAFNRSLEPARR